MSKPFWNGYKTAVLDFATYRHGALVIGCLSNPVKDMLKKRYQDFYPDCPDEHCSGCPGCEGIKNPGALE